MNLLNLAPGIQEALLFLPLTESGRDIIRELHMRPLAADMAWDSQRHRWARLQSAVRR